ncbi:MAG TPA: hypothetical protein VJM46_03460 [Candidatus Saccharimonadales bacterium]|nr:hypothetical protein [Candidatus Saccharimonadales bacterium]
MANRTSQPTQAGVWRYRIAGWLALSALVLGTLSYLNRPTSNLFSAEGNDDLHRMVWMAVAAVACTLVSLILALHEFSARHGKDFETEAQPRRRLTRV